MRMLESVWSVRQIHMALARIIHGWPSAHSTDGIDAISLTHAWAQKSG